MDKPPPASSVKTPLLIGTSERSSAIDAPVRPTTATATGVDLGAEHPPPTLQPTGGGASDLTADRLLGPYRRQDHALHYEEA